LKNTTKTSNRFPVVLTRGFVAVEFIIIVAGLVASLLNADALLVGWAVLFVLLFSSAGWFFSELDSSTGWPTLLVFIFGWALPLMVSNSIGPVGAVSYLAGFFAARLFKGKTGFVPGQRIRANLVFFFSILFSGIVLLVVSYPVAIKSSWFWVLLVSLSATGWLSLRITRAADRWKVQGQSWGVVIYVTIILIGLGVGLSLGVPYAVAGILMLLLALLLRLSSVQSLPSSTVLQRGSVSPDLTRLGESKA
jgi:hypothetical protein